MNILALPPFRCPRLAAAASALVLFCSPGQAQTVYSCNFEPGSQGSAFTTGSVDGQGAPPWSGIFLHGYDVAGNVVSGQSGDGGAQSLQIAGVQSSRVTLDAPVQNQWFEFAFKPNFTEGNSATTWALTTRGGSGDVWGIQMGLSWDGSSGTIYVGGIGAGVTGEGAAVGTFENGQWQTISFKANNVVGTYEVYLGNNTTPVGTFSPAGFNGVQTLVFSSATQSWENTGDWYIDGIRVAGESAYVFFPAEGSWTGNTGPTWSNTDSLQGESVIFSEPLGTAFINQAGTFFNVEWDNPSNVATQMTDGSADTWARGLVADGWPEIPPEPPVNHWVIDLGESGAPTRQLDSFAMWMLADNIAGGVRADQPLIYVSGNGTDWLLVGKMPTDYQASGPGYNKVAWTFPSGKVTGFRYIMVETGVYPMDFGYKNQAWVEWDGEISSTASAPSISIARAGNNLEVTWTGGTLQSTTDLAIGPWTAVPEATSPLIFAPSVPKQFYRVVQP